MFKLSESRGTGVMAVVGLAGLIRPAGMSRLF